MMRLSGFSSKFRCASMTLSCAAKISSGCNNGHRTFASMSGRTTGTYSRNVSTWYKMSSRPTRQDTAAPSCSSVFKVLMWLRCDDDLKAMSSSMCGTQASPAVSSRRLPPATKRPSEEQRPCLSTTTMRAPFASLKNRTWGSTTSSLVTGKPSTGVSRLAVQRTVPTALVPDRTRSGISSITADESSRIMGTFWKIGGRTASMPSEAARVR
mmetsp:Transcript_2427/g.7072  ORF Transcript_2427/g.7072 Transcript_2427/m.7072 type:complete len:211 (+) Transcript_2427:1008-1640(+)